MHVVERFAQWAVASRGTALAPDVLHHAKRAVVDLHAAMISGAAETPATLLEKALADELDRGEARLALGRKATMRAAALINAAAIVNRRNSTATTSVPSAYAKRAKIAIAPKAAADSTTSSAPHTLSFIARRPSAAKRRWRMPPGRRAVNRVATPEVLRICESVTRLFAPRRGRTV